ncbi:MAG: PDZ domain-containing protein [Gemmatimonadales bacterium]|nr:PDZ domain-containing protein [Gemmatimonadales bacterium]
MSTINAGKRLPLFVFSLMILFTSSLALAGDDPGYLGVYLQDLEPSMVKALQLDDKSGVLISEIVEDSPAQKAGLEDGDVILIFNGKEIESSKVLTKAVRKAGSGENVKVVILRDGKEKTLKVELGEQDDETFIYNGDKLKKLLKLKELKELGKLDSLKWIEEEDCHIEIFEGNRGVMGIHIDDLSEQMGEYFDVENGEGVLVTEIVKDGAAGKAGMKAGDVIVKMDGQNISSTGELHKALADTEAEQEMKVEVRRKGDKKEFKVTLGEASGQEFIRKIKIMDGEHHNLRTPRMKMHMGSHFKHQKDLHGEDHNVFLYHDDDEEGRIVIKRHGNDLEELRKELKNLKKELKVIQEKLEK